MVQSYKKNRTYANAKCDFGSIYVVKHLYLFFQQFPQRIFWHRSCD